MKLRQKLAVVMASAMVVTAVPVVTMADSTADRTNRPVYVKDGGLISTTEEKQNLKITLEDSITTNGQVYVYLNLIDGTFTGDNIDVAITVYDGKKSKKLAADTAYVDVTPYSSTAILKFNKDVILDVNEKAELMIPLDQVNVTGDTKIWIDGNDSEIDDLDKEDAILIATKKADKASVSAGDIPNLYSTSRYGTAVSDILIKEDVNNRINSKTIRITVDHEDYEFYANNLGQNNYPEGTITVKGDRGFDGKIIDPATGKIGDTAQVTYRVIEHYRDEYEEIELTLPEVDNAAGDGIYVLQGLKVVSETREPRQGDLEFTVKPAPVDGADIATTSLKVANVLEFGTDLTVKEKVEVKSGKIATPQISYTERTAYSAGSGDVDFELDQDLEDWQKSKLKAIAYKPLYTGADGARIDNEQVIIDEINKTNGSYSADKKGIVQAIEYIYEDGWKNSRKDDRYDHVIGFILTVDADEDKDYDEKATKFFGDLPIDVQTTLDMNREVTLTANGRFENESSVVIANTTPNVKFEGSPVTLKVGQSKQVGGKLVISEVEQGAFDRHAVMQVALPEKSGLSFTELPKVTVDGAEVKAKFNIDNTVIFLEVDRHSTDKPAVITLEDIKMTVDRTVPQDEYDVTLSFVDDRTYEGVGAYAGGLTIADFFVIGTPNTEELPSNGLPIGTATFTIGSKNYTLGDKTFEMDAAAYIQDPGYTMVPMRYVAKAFGVAESDILFSKGKTTIIAGGRTIQLTSGSSEALINGAPIEMDTKVVIKEGRTYAPVGEIGRLLGIKSEWDSATKTAKFTNSAK